MKQVAMALGLVLIPALVGVEVYRQRAAAWARQLEQARAAVERPSGAALLDELAERYPKHAEIQFLHARQLRLQGENDAASAGLLRAAELGWPREQVDREQLLVLAQKDFARAVPGLQSWLDADPGNRDVLLALASGYSRQRYYERAERLVNPLLQRDPNDGTALSLRGRIRYAGTADLPAARRDLERALELGKDRYYESVTRVTLAACLLDLGKSDEASALFRQCRAESPDNPLVLRGLGRSARLSNRLDEAEEALQALRRLRPDDVVCLLELAYVYEERNDLPRALELLEEAERLDPKSYEIPFRLAKVLRGLGQTERAAAYQKRYEQEKGRFLGKTANPDRKPTPPGPDGAP